MRGQYSCLIAENRRLGIVTSECTSPYNAECCLQMAIKAFGSKVISSRDTLVITKDETIPQGALWRVVVTGRHILTNKIR